MTPDIPLQIKALIASEIAEYPTEGREGRMTLDAFRAALRVHGKAIGCYASV